MTYKERQIDEIINTIADANEIYVRQVDKDGFSDIGYSDRYAVNKKVAEALYNAGYRKMDEVTLRLDLGDRSAEEIAQIEEAFNDTMTNSLTVVDTMDDGLRLSLEAEKEKEAIEKQVATEILTDLTALINNNEGFVRGMLGWSTEEVKMLVKLHIKKKYGVEIEE